MISLKNIDGSNNILRYDVLSKIPLSNILWDYYISNPLYTKYLQWIISNDLGSFNNVEQ